MAKYIIFNDFADVYKTNSEQDAREAAQYAGNIVVDTEADYILWENETKDIPSYEA